MAKPLMIDPKKSATCKFSFDLMLLMIAFIVFNFTGLKYDRCYFVYKMNDM